MKSLSSLIWAVAVMVAVSLVTAEAQTMNGNVARVIDGDTFVYNDGTRIRLCGINAPEKNQKGGNEATSFLTRMIEKEPVRCKIVGGGTPCDGRSKKKSYNRTVAQCFYNGDDIAKIMVRNGHAKDSKRYSGGYYKK